MCIVVFYLFSSGGNLPLQSYWSLYCDHALHFRTTTPTITKEYQVTRWKERPGKKENIRIKQKNKRALREHAEW